ncbi:MAG: class I SAM-dependent methyltransferase [Ectothiorhodospiraceae bacterium]|nr:class I SAM-dependent methyltransferase [Ectothiorhodospiraceae bacterium]MCH8504186.1 cyclopropane-fatty-acyl-phospholipid synthase family protein [Ectothiorhodospiraceae bacterium]
MQQLIGLVERGIVPDMLVRAGIRRLLRQRLDESYAGNCEDWHARTRSLLLEMRKSPVALSTERANEQHYELPAGFFQQVLGHRLKYSCCLWEEGTGTLDQAEDRMLALTCERASLKDGDSILELGCGWGALSLWMAEHYPNSAVTAVSNSSSQRAFIEARRHERGLKNLSVVTVDMNDFQTSERFDRVVSLEMFEHMRNWPELLRRISGWLAPNGTFFMHVFCHREQPYIFEIEGEHNWMGRHFFTDGLMPSDSLPYHMQQHLQLEAHWRVNGRHYQRTSEAWLQRMDGARQELQSVFAEVYGADQVERWINRWRVFFLACAELFGFNRGNEWYVGHYLFRAPEQAE